MKEEEFYIGYLEKAPRNTGRFIRITSIGLILAGVIISLLLVFGQQAFYPSTYEFLNYRSFEGVVVEHPYPMLRVMRPGKAGDLPTYSHYYLVNEGKFGMQRMVEGLEGVRIRLDGALIYRDDQVMIEVKPGTLQEISDQRSGTSDSEVSLGTYTLLGEIVDSKCFLGVMNPGSQKPHRACAVRCISGGIPPMFVVRDAEERTTYLLLQADDGRAIHKEILDRIAEPLEIRGEVFQYEDVLMLKADPSTYRRLNP